MIQLAFVRLLVALLLASQGCVLIQLEADSPPFTQVTDVIFGEPSPGAHDTVLPVLKSTLLRVWSLGEDVDLPSVIEELIRAFRANPKQTLTVLVIDLRLSTRAALFKTVEEISPLLRNVFWVLLHFRSSNVTEVSWESFPQLSCDVAVISPSLRWADVPVQHYNTTCLARRTIPTAQLAMQRLQKKLTNAIVRAGCYLAGSDRRCATPTAVALLEALSFVNATVRMTQSKDRVGLGIYNGNGFFSGSLGQVQRREFDLYLVDISEGIERRSALDFMGTTYMAGMSFVAYLPTEKGQATEVRTFSTAVFLVMALFTCGTSLVLSVLSGKDFKLATFLDLSLRLLFLLFAQSTDFFETSAKRHLSLRRMILTLWLLLSVVVGSALRSTLISQFRNQRSSTPVDSVKTLENLLMRRSMYPCLVNGTGSSYYVLSSSQNCRLVYRLLKERTLENVSSNILDQPQQCYKKAVDGTHAYLDSYTALRLMQWEGRGSVVISKEPLAAFFGGNPVPFGWPYADHMRQLTARVVESGLIVYHERIADWRNKSLILPDLSQESYNDLTMEHFRISFLFLAGGVALGALTFALEILVTTHSHMR